MFLVQTWPAYVRRITGEMKQEQISETTGISQTTISAWLRGAPLMPKAETVIAFAKAYKQPAVEALVAAGYLEASDAAATVRTPLREFSTDELLSELRRRSTG